MYEHLSEKLNMNILKMTEWINSNFKDFYQKSLLEMQY